MRPLAAHLCIIGILMKYLVDMGYFFSKNHVYRYKRNGAFQRTNAPFGKGRLLIVVTVI